MIPSDNRTAFERACRGHADSRGSKGSRNIYRHDLDLWLAWADERSVDVCDPELDDVSAFKVHLLEHMAEQTVRRILSTLSTMYDVALARKEKIVTWNPFHAKVLQRPPANAYAETRAITPDQAHKIIAQAVRDKTPEGRRDEAVLKILYFTGLRRSSVASLLRHKLEKVPDGWIAKVKVKGGKWMESHIVDSAAVALTCWLRVAPESDYVFPGARGKTPMHPDTVNRIVKARGLAAGVPDVHPHTFRAAFATESLDAGVPLHEVQAAMHHVSPLTTLRYDRGVRGRGVTTTLAKHRRERGGE